MHDKLNDNHGKWTYLEQNIEALSENETSVTETREEEALVRLMSFQKKLPSDFDYKAELERAMEEKYESAG